MSEALMEIMKPIIEPMPQQQVRQDIQVMVAAFRRLGHDELVIKDSSFKGMRLKFTTKVYKKNMLTMQR